MAYRHKYFILDSNSRKVFDENSKELQITGNVYRVLEFLCQKENATLTQIGTYLDFAKEYTENHIRQYRYKINTIIGHKVMDYKNGVYSLLGDVENVIKIENNDRNTNLLHSDFLELNQSDKDDLNIERKVNFYKAPAVIAIVVLLVSFLPWPYGYYTLLKLVVTGVAIYYAYYIYKVIRKKNFWFWLLVIVAILFNPVIPVYLWNKGLWMIIDIFVVIFFVGLIVKLNKYK